MVSEKRGERRGWRRRGEKVDAHHKRRAPWPCPARPELHLRERPALLLPRGTEAPRRDPNRQPRDLELHGTRHDTGCKEVKERAHISTLHTPQAVAPAFSRAGE